MGGNSKIRKKIRIENHQSEKWPVVFLYPFLGGLPKIIKILYKTYDVEERENIHDVQSELYGQQGI